MKLDQVWADYNMIYMIYAYSCVRPSKLYMAIYDSIKTKVSYNYVCII